MALFDFILWNVNPEIPVINQIYPVRWYGLFFAIAFLAGQRIMQVYFQKENIDEKYLDKLTLSAVIGVVIGARLGHCLFYDFQYYVIENPIEILYIWEGGLASHGGGIGIITAVLLFYRKHKTVFKNPLWILDRLAIAVAIGACLVRFGNLTNSEIIGKPSDAPYAFLFAKSSEMQLENFYSEIEDISISKAGADTLVNGFTYPELSMQIKLNPNELKTSKEQLNFTSKYVFSYLSKLEADEKHITFLNQNDYSQENNTITVRCWGITRHPAQLYESLSSLILFALLFLLMKRFSYSPPQGLLFGIFLSYIFTLRFFYEFLKENQVSMEDDLLLNMGQILSIPMVIVGLFFITTSLLKKTQ